jgi:hypothetical protein
VVVEVGVLLLLMGLLMTIPSHLLLVRHSPVAGVAAGVGRAVLAAAALG